MQHPPFARGVSHLMYVGDVEERASVLSSPIFWMAAVAVAGGAVGIDKTTRKIAGVAALVTFLAL